MIKIVIISSVIILITSFKSANGFSRNIDALCVQNLQNALDFDRSLYISVCKYVNVEGIPRTGMLLPSMLNVKIKSISFEINLHLRKKHFPASLNTPVIVEYIDKNGKFGVEHTNVSKIVGVQSVAYYSDMKKNAAMIGFYDKDLTVEGVIGKYTLRYVPGVNWYILFIVSFPTVPILNQNFIVPDIVDDVLYDLKSHIDYVNMKLVVAIDDVLIGGKATRQTIIGALIHINAADFLFSKFTRPRISLSIHGIILPFSKQHAIYGTTYNDISTDSRLQNIRTTQVKESNDFFVSRRRHFSFNDYHLGIIITTLPICDIGTKNCDLYVSGYNSYECPHRMNAHSKATIVRSPDFYGNYAATGQNIKRRFVRKFLRRFDKADEDIQLNNPLKGWSRTDVENLSAYFQSNEAECWQIIIPTTPRPKIRTTARKPVSRYDLRVRPTTTSSTTTTSTTTTERINGAGIERPIVQRGKIDTVNYTEEYSAIKFKNRAPDIQKGKVLEQGIHSVENKSPGSREHANGTVDRPSVGGDMKKEIKVSPENLERPTTVQPERIRNDMMKGDELYNTLIKQEKLDAGPSTTLKIDKSSSLGSEKSKSSVKTVMTTSKTVNVSRPEQITTVKPGTLKNRAETRNAMNGPKIEPSHPAITEVTATTPKSTRHHTIERIPFTKSVESESKINKEEKNSTQTSHPSEQPKSSVIPKLTTESIFTESKPIAESENMTLKIDKLTGSKLQMNEINDKTVTATSKQENTPGHETILAANPDATDSSQFLRFNRSIIRIPSVIPEPTFINYFKEDIFPLPKNTESETRAIEKNTQSTPTSNPGNEARSSVTSGTPKPNEKSISISLTTAQSVSVSTTEKVTTLEPDSLENRMNTKITKNGSKVKSPHQAIDNIALTTPKTTEKYTLEETPSTKPVKSEMRTIGEDTKSFPIEKLNDKPGSVTSAAPKPTETSTVMNLTTAEVKNITLKVDESTGKKLRTNEATDGTMTLTSEKGNKSSPEKTTTEKTNELKYEINIKNEMNSSKIASFHQPMVTVGSTTPKMTEATTRRVRPSTENSKSEKKTIENETVAATAISNQSNRERSLAASKTPKLVEKLISPSLTTIKSMESENGTLVTSKSPRLNSEADTALDNEKITTSLEPIDVSDTKRMNTTKLNKMENDTDAKDVINSSKIAPPRTIIGKITSTTTKTTVENILEKKQISKKEKSKNKTIKKNAEPTFKTKPTNKRGSLETLPTPDRTENGLRVMTTTLEPENTSQSGEMTLVTETKLVNNTNTKNRTSYLKTEFPHLSIVTQTPTTPLTIKQTTGKSSRVEPLRSKKETLKPNTTTPLNSMEIDDSSITDVDAAVLNRANIPIDYENVSATTEKGIDDDNTADSIDSSIINTAEVSTISPASKTALLAEQTTGKSSEFDKVKSKNKTLNPKTLTILNSTKIKDLNSADSNTTTSNRKNHSSVHRNVPVTTEELVDVTHTEDSTNSSIIDSAEPSTVSPASRIPLIPKQTTSKPTRMDKVNFLNHTFIPKNSSPLNLTTIDDTNMTSPNQANALIVNKKILATTKDLANDTNPEYSTNLSIIGSAKPSTYSPASQTLLMAEQTTKKPAAVNHVDSLNHTFISENSSLLNLTAVDNRNTTSPYQANPLIVTKINRATTGDLANDINPEDSTNPSIISSAEPSIVSPASQTPLMTEKTTKKPAELDQVNFPNHTFISEKSSPLNLTTIDNTNTSSPNQANAPIANKEIQATTGNLFDVTNTEDSRNSSVVDTVEPSTVLLASQTPIIGERTIEKPTEFVQMNSPNHTFLPKNSSLLDLTTINDADTISPNQANPFILNENVLPTTGYLVNGTNPEDSTNPSIIGSAELSTVSPAFQTPLITERTTKKPAELDQVNFSNHTFIPESLSLMNLTTIDNPNTSSLNQANPFIVNKNIQATIEDLVNVTNPEDSTNSEMIGSTQPSTFAPAFQTEPIPEPTTWKPEEMDNVNSPNHTFIPENSSPLNLMTIDDLDKTLPNQANLSIVNKNILATAGDLANVTNPKYSTNPSIIEFAKPSTVLPASQTPLITERTPEEPAELDEVNFPNHTFVADNSSLLNLTTINDTKTTLLNRANGPISNKSILKTSANLVDVTNTEDSTDSLIIDTAEPSTVLLAFRTPIIGEKTIEKPEELDQVSSPNHNSIPENSSLLNVTTIDDLDKTVPNQANLSTVNKNILATTENLTYVTNAEYSTIPSIIGSAEPSTASPASQTPFIIERTLEKPAEFNQINSPNHTFIPESLSLLNLTTIDNPNTTLSNQANPFIVNKNIQATTEDLVNVTNPEDSTNPSIIGSAELSTVSPASQTPLMTKQTTEKPAEFNQMNSPNHTSMSGNSSLLNVTTVNDMNTTSLNQANDRMPNKEILATSGKLVDVKDTEDSTNSSIIDTAEPSTVLLASQTTLTGEETIEKPQELDQVSSPNHTFIPKNSSLLNLTSIGDRDKTLPNQANPSIVNKNILATTGDLNNVTIPEDSTNPSDISSAEPSTVLPASQTPLMTERTNEKIAELDQVNPPTHIPIPENSSLSNLTTIDDLDKTLPNQANPFIVNKDIQATTRDLVNVTNPEDSTNSEMIGSAQPSTFAPAFQTEPIPELTTWKPAEINTVNSPNHTFIPENSSLLNLTTIGDLDKSLPNQANPSIVNKNILATTGDLANVTIPEDSTNPSDISSAEPSTVLPASQTPHMTERTNEKIAELDQVNPPTPISIPENSSLSNLTTIDDLNKILPNQANPSIVNKNIQETTGDLAHITNPENLTNPSDISSAKPSTVLPASQTPLMTERTTEKPEELDQVNFPNHTFLPENSSTLKLTTIDDLDETLPNQANPFIVNKDIQATSGDLVNVAIIGDLTNSSIIDTAESSTISPASQTRNNQSSLSELRNSLTVAIDCPDLSNSTSQAGDSIHGSLISPFLFLPSTTTNTTSIISNDSSASVESSLITSRFAGLTDSEMVPPGSVIVFFSHNTEKLTVTPSSVISESNGISTVIEDKMADDVATSTLDSLNRRSHNNSLHSFTGKSTVIPSDHLPDDKNLTDLTKDGSQLSFTFIDILSELSSKSTSTESNNTPEYPSVPISGMTNHKELSSTTLSSSISTTESAKLDSPEKTSDSTMLIFYASLSVPLLLAVAFISYMISLLCRRRRRHRSHLR